MLRSAERAAGTIAFKSCSRLVGARRISRAIVRPAQFLLIRNTLIDCDQDMEAAGFSSIQQLSILQSCKPSKPSGLTVVIRKKKAEAFIDALVE